MVIHLVLLQIMMPLLTLHHQRMTSIDFGSASLTNTTTCFGCRGKFTKAADGNLPIAPLDLILQCNESRPYYDRDGTLKEKENANTYYHPNASCIKMKHKEFMFEDIQLEEDVRYTLEPSHFELLQSVFNFCA